MLRKRLEPDRSELVRRVVPGWKLVGILVVLAAGVQVPVVLGQDISTYYTVLHPEKFEIDWTSFYKEINKRTAQTRNLLPHHLDLSYGDHPKQALDLYLPNTAGPNMPVLLFFHGGGFREGDRAQYGFIAEPFAARGVIVAVASYRLTIGGFQYPAQVEDAREAVAWLYRNAAIYGGDPSAIYVAGHSAGAILAADLSVNRSWLERRGIPKNSLRGFAPVSGPYDLRISGHPGEGDAYASSPEQQIDASPLFHVHDPARRALVVLGTAGQEQRFHSSSKQLVERLAAVGTAVDLLILQDLDHSQTALSLADPSSQVFQRIMEMMSISP